MLQTISQTALSARNAEAALVQAIDDATLALDGIARDPLAESLARLQEAAEAAQARLHAGRLRARSLLVDALLGFEAFEVEIVGGTGPVLELTSPEPELCIPAEEPAPVDQPTPLTMEPSRPPLTLTNPDEVVSMAANPPVEEPAPAVPLSPAPEIQPVQSIGDLTEEMSEAREANPGLHAADAAEESAPPAPKKGRGRKGRA